MRKTVFPAALAILCLAAVSCHRETEVPRISIFCDHIETVARQEGISFAEAATRLKEAGYAGADIRVFQKPEEIRTLDSLGFAHACAITDINYSAGDQRELEDKTLAFMKERGFDRLLLVTGLMPAQGYSLAEREAARSRIAAFAARVTAEGFDIMVEDFDNRRSLCYDAARLDSLFAVSGDLGLAFDSGNFLFAGDDPMEQLNHFRGRIRHVHLKDRTSATDMTCKPVGTGCIDMEGIIRALVDTGYKGWLTVEQYGSRNMLEDSRTSIRNVTAILTAE